MGSHNREEVCMRPAADRRNAAVGQSGLTIDTCERLISGATALNVGAATCSGSSTVERPDPGSIPGPSTDRSGSTNLRADNPVRPGTSVGGRAPGEVAYGSQEREDASGRPQSPPLTAPGCRLPQHATRLRARARWAR